MRIGKVILIKGLMPFLVFTFVSCQYQDNKVDSKEDVRTKKGAKKMSYYVVQVGTNSVGPNISKVGKIIKIDFENFFTLASNVSPVYYSGVISSVPINLNNVKIKSVTLAKDIKASVSVNGYLIEYDMNENLIPFPHIVHEKITVGFTSADLTDINIYATDLNSIPSRIYKKLQETLFLTSHNLYTTTLKCSEYKIDNIDAISNLNSNANFLTTTFYFVPSGNIREDINSTLTASYNSYFGTLATGVSLTGITYRISVLLEIQ